MKSRKTKDGNVEINIQLTAKEIVLVQTLLKHQNFLSTREISDLASVHWQTAYKHLKKFKNRGWVAYRKRGKKELWKTYLLGLKVED